MRSYWIGVDLIQPLLFLHEERILTQENKAWHVRTKAEVGVMLPEATESKGSPASTRREKRQGRILP